MTNLDQFTRAPQGSFKLQRKLLAATVAACFGVAQANPTLPQVVAGQATFAQQGNVFSITNTPNTIINWQSFSVGRDEITRFIQQSSDSKVLNRITGQDPSQILGSLQSNGQVFLINPNGVLFGKDARIDVNGLVASSLQLSNSDFLAGKHNFQGEAGAGKVVNQGSITTPQGGKVFLIAPTVENHGVISAPNGEILLAAGKSVQLVDSANPAITVVVSAPEDQALNLGQIVAQGGRVGIYGALVNQRGVVNANSAVRGENGKIILKASRSTLLEAGSQTTASGAGKGGEIQILGQNVALNGDARVDASGREGGGTVLLGGDYQGKNSAVQNARQAFVGKNAVIRADAEASGDGGKVIVWADESTRAYGAISARSAGGKGGFVETSGHYLDVAGLRVDTTGLDATGVWLLDPYNIEVVGGGYGNGYGLADAADFSGGAPSPSTTKIEASLINNASSNVVLQATNDISIDTAVNMTEAGKSFTAYAGNDINVNADLQTNGGAIGLYANYASSGSASGHGAVNLLSGRTIGSGAADITLSGISLNLNGSVTATPGGARVGNNAPLISLRATNLDITGSVNNSAGDGGYVSIAPFISTYNMAVMGFDSPSAGTMVLNADDLSRVHAYELALGGASVGNVSISAPLNLDANLVVDAKSGIQQNGAINAGGHNVFFHLYDDSGTISQGGGAITAQRLTVRANSGDVVLNNADNEVGAIDLHGTNISYAGHGATTVEGLRQRAGAEPGEASIYVSSGTLTLKNTDVEDSLNINAPTVNVADGGSVKADALHLHANQFGVLGSGTVTATDSMLITTSGNVTLGDTLGETLTAVEGSLHLNSATLGAITTPMLAVSGGEGGDIELQSLALPNTSLSLNAYYGQVRSRGVVSAKSITMTAEQFDLGAAGTSLTASEVFSVYATGDYGRLAITSATPSDTAAISADALGHITAGTLELNGSQVTVSEAITRNSGGLSLNAHEGTVTLNAPVAASNGSLSIVASTAAINQAASGSQVLVTANALEFDTSGSITASDFVNLSSINDVYVGGTATSADGLLLNNETLGKISTPSLHVSSYSGDVVAAGIDRGAHYLGLHAARTLRTEGAIKAEGISLSAETFDIGAASSLDAGEGMLTISGSPLSGGTLQVNGTGGDGISLFNTAALSQVLSDRVQFDAYNGVTLAGDLVTDKELLFTSGQGKVQINALVDTGDTGSINIQSKEVGIAHRIHAGTVTLAPLSRYVPETNTHVPASMVIGGDCAVSLDCMAIKDLAQVDAENVVLGNAYSTSTMLVAGIGGSGSAARHANTTKITLRARDGISQDGAINVNTLWVGTNGSTVLTDAGNAVSKLGIDWQDGMSTDNLSFTNSTSLTYDGGAASGTIDLNVTGDLSSGQFKLAANKLVARATGAVGGEVPMWTQVKVLDVETTGTTGKSSINIINNQGAEMSGPLAIDRLVVANTSAAITLQNYGATTVSATTESAGNVRSGAGAISITAHSPLTVNGRVISQSGVITLEAGTSTTPSNDVLAIVGSNARVQSGAAVALKGGSAVNYSASQVSGSSLTVNGQVVSPPVNPPPTNPPPVDPPPVDPPPVNPPPVDPPPVDPPPVNPPPVDPPPVNPPPVDPPPVDPPPVNPPPVNPPPVDPPPVNPPPVNPPPTADICTIAPNSALCQVLSPPTASEPVKPVQAASKEVIKTITRESTAPGSSSGSSGKGSDSSGGPVATDKDEQKKAEKETAVTEKQGTQNEKPAAKTYCN